MKLFNNVVHVGQVHPSPPPLSQLLTVLPQKGKANGHTGSTCTDSKAYAEGILGPGHGSLV